MKKTSLPFVRSKTVLAVETDDFVTRAAVFAQGKGGSIVVQGRGEVKSDVLSEALGSLLQGFKSQGVAVPKHAVLLSPHIHVVTLELPVNPRKPLPLRQFQELLRWEVEPYVSRHRARRIGAILVGRGYLLPNDVERLLREIEAEPLGKARRLGDCAIEARLITGEQLAECLALQQTTLVGEGEVAYGWVAHDTIEQKGKWVWSVAAMNDVLRRDAIKAFAGQGLQLKAFYPLVGCACVGLNGQADPASAVFEYRSGHLGYTRFARKQVVSRRNAFTQEFRNPIRECADMFETEAQQVWLAGNWPNVDEAVRELETGLGRPCLRLDAKIPEMRGDVDVGMEGMSGVARHILGCADERLAVAVPARDPRPPLWRNWAVLMTTISLAASAAMMILALRLDARTKELSNVVQAGKVLDEVRNEHSRLNAQKASLENTIARLQQLLPARQQTAARVLDALQRCCSDEMMLKRIKFDLDGETEFQGWGLTAQSVQLFKLQLQERLHDFSITDETKPIRREDGWSQLPGYGFEFRMKNNAAASSEKRP